MFQTTGIVTGGGDAPGLNAVIRAVVRTAIRQYRMRVVRIENSFEGLTGELRVRDLTTANVASLLPSSCSILGMHNKGQFCRHTPDGVSLSARSV